MLYNSSKLVVQLFIPERAVGKKILIMDKQLTAWFNLQEGKIVSPNSSGFKPFL